MITLLTTLRLAIAMAVTLDAIQPMALVRFVPEVARIALGIP